MSWRGQGGKRAKGRRGDQDPELDSTAWLAELEREAAQAADDEDDWASTLRGRRASAPPSTATSPPVPPPPATSPPAPQPPLPPPDYTWAPAADPDPSPAAGRQPGTEPGEDGSGFWPADPRSQEPPPTEPDWSTWRPAAREAFQEPEEPGTDWGRERAGDEDWRSATVDTPTGAWSPVEPEPVGREPDYPALFGELYRRSASQQQEQDPIWEAPPAPEPPPPDHGPLDPPSGSWPFEDTTQSWEPSDRSFIWPNDELPSTQPEWEPSTSRPWMDDPPPAPGAPDPRTADPRQDADLWTTPSTSPADPLGSPSGGLGSGSWGSDVPYEGFAGPGNGASPPMGSAGPMGPGSAGSPVGPRATGPPPADWAEAIPTDVPAAERAADATRVWRPDAVEGEPGVPLGGAAAGGAARRPRPQAAGAGMAGSQAGMGAGTSDPWADVVPADEAAEVRPEGGRRDREPGERRARTWPRVVAVISWIVLLMVVCWFYVFPWLERVLPENF